MKEMAVSAWDGISGIITGAMDIVRLAMTKFEILLTEIMSSGWYQTMVVEDGVSRTLEAIATFGASEEARKIAEDVVVKTETVQSFDDETRRLKEEGIKPTMSDEVKNIMSVLKEEEDRAVEAGELKQESEFDALTATPEEIIAWKKEQNANALAHTAAIENLTEATGQQTEAQRLAAEAAGTSAKRIAGALENLVKQGQE